MKQVEIYTDGACRGNGKKGNIGAYGIVLIYGQVKREIKKAFRETTNNIMELLSVVDALSMLKEPCDVRLYSDSAYVVNAICENWLYGWVRNSWHTANGKSVKNQELWVRLLELLKIHKVQFIKVKGHSDNEYNNLCDKLANQAMDEMLEMEEGTDILPSQGEQKKD